MRACACVCVRVRVRACARARACACVRARACACVRARVSNFRYRFMSASVVAAAAAGVSNLRYRFMFFLGPCRGRAGSPTLTSLRFVFSMKPAKYVEMAAVSTWRRDITFSFSPTSPSYRFEKGAKNTEVRAKRYETQRPYASFNERPLAEMWRNLPSLHHPPDRANIQHPLPRMPPWTRRRSAQVENQTVLADSSIQKCSRNSQQAQSFRMPPLVDKTQPFGP